MISGQAGYKGRMMAALLVVLTLWATVAIAGVNEDLLAAAKRGDLLKVKSLLAKGADVNAKVDHGYTALMVASLNGHKEVVKLMLAKGADVNARSNDGETALMMAAQEDVKKLLIMAGASSSSEPGVVIASPRVMDFLKTLGPDVVFFTSKEHPLKSLSDITDGSEFGAWGPGPGASIQDLMTLKYMICAGGGLQMIGGLGNLFQKHPQLKLFVTFRGIAGVDSIESTGGGMKVHFVESNN